MRGAVARRLVHGRGAGRRHLDARADGGRAADLSRAGAARQAGRQHRPHQRRPAVAQRRLVVVGGRGQAVRRAVRPARRSLRPHAPSGWTWSTGCGATAAFSFTRAASTASRTRSSSPSRCGARGRIDLRRRRVRGGAGRSSPAPCDAYVMHGDPPERDRAAHRRHGGRGASRPACRRCSTAWPATPIVRDTEREARDELARITDVQAPARPGTATTSSGSRNTQLEQRVSLEDYSVSNRGLRAGLVGTPEQVSGAGRGVRGRRRRPAAAAVQPAARGDGALLAARSFSRCAPLRFGLGPDSTVRPAERGRRSLEWTTG